ncbi:stalk domain-containing protein [Paenibacillus guangzhouensis]|uniref:stalk domain-containing protein n=1 Tax=Paenibacillus guangzhouensis TaxID=1473112 RepID=UPI0012673A92|nr:stalk domain-containing protein [Paenibacillus guangzhouensis]
MNKMSKMLLTTALFAAMLGTVPVAAKAPVSPTGVSATFNGKAIVFSEQPLLMNGRLLVPYRPIAEAIGAVVGYEAETRTVKVTEGSNIYLLPLESKTATLNGIPVALDEPAKVVNGVTMVPIRFVSENLGVDVKFDPAKKNVSLQSANTPSVRILGPTKDAMLYTDTVKVGVAVFNHALTDFRTHTEPHEGQGHVHIWLDTDASDPKAAYKMINAEPAVFDHVKPGKHTLTVQLVGNNHQPIKPEVKQVITFTTKAASDQPTVADKAESAKKYAVSISEFAFKPDQLTIEAGASVTFTNQDDVEHTVTAKDGSFTSEPLGKNDTFTKTFPEAGEYEIYCKPHNFMVGKIIVK